MPTACRRSRFVGRMSGKHEAMDWALLWLPEGGETVAESYVNLIPTPQGGTHVNGLRSGLTEAMREFCEFRNLLPRGVKLAPEDVWERVSYVLSVKIGDPQFSGQTKERLSSRECAGFVSGVVKDAFSLWLNQHIETGEQARRTGDRMPPAPPAGGQEGRAQEGHQRPRAAGQARGLHFAGFGAYRAVPSRGRLGRRLGQAGA